MEIAGQEVRDLFRAGKEVTTALPGGSTQDGTLADADRLLVEKQLRRWYSLVGAGDATADLLRDEVEELVSA